MKQWLNFSHPQTLQASVFLGYLSAVFGVIFGVGNSNPLPPWALTLIFIAMGVGAFFTANNRRWGYQLLAVTAGVIAATSIVGIVQFFFDERSTIANILLLVNNSVFPVALAAAVLHSHSREYQKIWFE